MQDKKAGQFNVLCLEKPFGINVRQNFEKGEGVYYDNVCKTDIKPEQTQVDRIIPVPPPPPPQLKPRKI